MFNVQPIRVLVDHEDTLLQAGLATLLARFDDLAVAPEYFEPGCAALNAVRPLHFVHAISPMKRFANASALS